MSEQIHGEEHEEHAGELAERRAAALAARGNGGAHLHTLVKPFGEVPDE